MFTDKELMIIKCSLEVYYDTVDESDGVSEYLKEMMKKDILALLKKLA